MAEYTFIVKKDIRTVIEYLTDTEKFVSVHPLIYKMVAVGDDTYRVFETLKVGGIPFRFRYRARITYQPGAVLIRATVMGLTKLSMHFTFFEDEGHTVVTERFEIQSLLPLSRFMNRLIEAQHQRMFEAIESA